MITAVKDMLGLASENWDVSVRRQVDYKLRPLMSKFPRYDVHLLPHLNYVVVGSALSETSTQGRRQVRILYLELSPICTLNLSLGNEF